MNKKYFLFVSILTVALFSCKNSMTIFFKAGTSDTVNLKSEIIANVKGSAHGIAIDDDNNVYVGKIKEIVKVGTDGTVSSFAIPDDAFVQENAKFFICDFELNKKENCYYAASGDRILKITRDGKMSTFIQEDFQGRYGAAGIAIDNDGNLYIASDNKILKYTADKRKSIFLDGADSKKVKVEEILGLEFDSTYKNLYFCETISGQLIKCTIKDGKPDKLYCYFMDLEYAPEYIAMIDDKNMIIKDPSFKHFYLIGGNKAKKIIVDNVQQKYTGIETIFFKDKILYGTNYDGQTLHRIDLSGVL